MTLREWYQHLGLSPHLADNLPSRNVRTAINQLVREGVRWKQHNLAFRETPLQLHPILQQYLDRFGSAVSGKGPGAIAFILHLDWTLRTAVPVFRDFLPALALSRTLYLYRTYVHRDFAGTIRQLDEDVANKIIPENQMLPVRMQYLKNLMVVMTAISKDGPTRISKVVEEIEKHVNSYLDSQHCGAFSSIWQDTVQRYEKGIEQYIQKYIQKVKTPGAGKNLIQNVGVPVLLEHFTIRTDPLLLEGHVSSRPNYAEHLLELWRRYAEMPDDPEGFSTVGFHVLLDAGASVGMWKLLENPASDRFPVWTGVAGRSPLSLLSQLRRMMIMNALENHAIPQNRKNAWIYEMARSMIIVSLPSGHFREEGNELDDDAEWSVLGEPTPLMMETQLSIQREEENRLPLMERFSFTRAILEKVRVMLGGQDAIWKDRENEVTAAIRNRYETYASLDPDELLARFSDLLEEWTLLCRIKKRGRPSREKRFFCQLCEELVRIREEGYLSSHSEELALIAALMDVLAERIG